MPKELGVVIDFRGKTVELDNSLNYINKNIKNLKKDIRALDKDLKLDLNTDTILKKFDALNYAIAESKKAAELYAKSIAEIDTNGYTKIVDGKEVQVTAEQAREQLTQLTAGLDETNARTKELQKQYDELQRTFNNLSTIKSVEQLKSLKSELYNTGSFLKGLGDAFKGISTLSWGGLTGAFNEAKNFESAFAGVMKTVDETATTTYENIEDNIRKMAKTLPSTTTEIAGIMEIAGQLGVSADDLTKFTKVMIDLSNATNIVGTEGATQLAQFYNVMQGDLDTVDRFGAALTHLGNNSATTEADILSMAKNLAGVSKNIGLTEQEVLALATSLTSVGISAEKGGSAITTVLLNIDREVATNGDKLEAWASILNTTGEEFSKAWNTDTIGVIKQIVGALGTVEEQGGQLSALLDDLGIKNIRQIDTITRLSNAYSNFDKYLEMSNVAWNENTALVNEANRRYGTTESQVKILFNNISELAMTLGKNLLPVINNIIKDLKPLITSLTKWVGANSGLVSSMLVVGSAISPVLTGLGKFAITSSNIVGGIIKLKEASLTASPALSGIAKVIGGASTTGLVGAAVAATAAIGYLFLKFAQSKDVVYQASQAFKESFANFQEAQLAADEAEKRSDLEISSLVTKSQEYALALDELMLKLQTANLTEEERTTTIELLKQKIDLLNQTLGEEAYSLDEGNLSLMYHGQQVDSVKQSYEELINQMRVEAWINANREAYEKATVALGEYQQKADVAQQKYLDDTKSLNLKELPLTQEQLEKTIDDMVAMGATNDQITQLRVAFTNNATEITKNAEKANELRRTMEVYEGVVKGTITDVTNLTSTGEKLNEVNEKSTTQLLLQKDALVAEQEQYINTYGTASGLINEQLKLITNELRERKAADEEAKTSNDSVATTVRTNYVNMEQAANESLGNIVTGLNQLRDYTLPEKIQVIRAEYVGFESNYGSMKNYSASGRTSSGGWGSSGGFGSIQLNNVINVSNNGQPITQDNVKSWGRMIADEVNLQLGRRMR